MLFRHTRSGFPDLTLWNPDAGQVKVVEVKGPGDRLSTKQILWIQFLNANEVESFVCKVEAVGGRKLVKGEDENERESAKKPRKKRKRKANDDDDDFVD